MLDVSSVSRLAASRTRSFCPENPHGESGGAAMAEVGAASRAARDLGRGWKIDPYVDIPPGATHELANLDEPGCVCHLRATTDRPHWRRLILRAYWDGADEPATEVPYGDFFCNGWGVYAHVASATVVGGYQTYTTPYLGLPQVIRPDGLYVSQQRFGMYRWHVPDPIRFAHRLGRPCTVRPALPGRDLLSV